MTDALLLSLIRACSLLSSFFDLSLTCFIDIDPSVELLSSHWIEVLAAKVGMNKIEVQWLPNFPNIWTVLNDLHIVLPKIDKIL